MELFNIQAKNKFKLVSRKASVSAKQVKKQRTRRKRAEAKKIDEEGLHPLHNKYHGYD